MLCNIDEFISCIDTHGESGELTTARPAHEMPKRNSRVVLQRNTGIVQSSTKISVVVIDEILRVHHTDALEYGCVQVHQACRSISNGYGGCDMYALVLAEMPPTGEPVAKTAATVPPGLTFAQVGKASPCSLPSIDCVTAYISNEFGTTADVVIYEHDMFDAIVPSPIDPLIVACRDAQVGLVSYELASHVMSRGQLPRAI